MLRVRRPGSRAGSPQAAAWALVVMSSLLAYLLTGQWGVIMATLSHSSAVGSSERCTSCEKVEVLYECKIIKLYCLLLVGCACVNLSVLWVGKIALKMWGIWLQHWIEKGKLGWPG